MVYVVRVLDTIQKPGILSIHFDNIQYSIEPSVIEESTNPRQTDIQTYDCTPLKALFY